MKTAKEMFEELGYEQTTNCDSVRYITKVRFGIYSSCEDIYFDLTDKSFLAEMWIDIPTFKAIRQQLKELGWIDE